MNIKITADSTCDLSADILKEYNIAITPLTVIKAGTGYIDGVTITPAEIFAHVAAGGDLCSTSAVSVGEYQEHFTKYAGEYDGVVHICISSDFSSTYRHACIAAEDFENVRVVDSRNLSTGQCLVVLKACELAKTAASLDELKRELDDFTSRVEASFLVDRLDYLVRGGRCSSAAALGANLLNLKPCIEVKDGKMTPGKKYRGPIDKVMLQYTQDRLQGRDDINRHRVFITHTRCAPEAVEAVRQKLLELCPDFEEIIETTAGSTVTSHCGPGTLGVLFIRSK